MNSKFYPKPNRKISLQVQSNHPKQYQQAKKKEIESQKEISSEFLIRQKVYEDLYKFPNYHSVSIVNTSERKEAQNNKFRTIIQDAKKRFIDSDSQHSKYNLEKQQSAMKFIVEYLRDQKRLQNKSKEFFNQTQNTKKIELNIVLSLAIPMLCFIVVFLELFKQKSLII
ncbi:unnamed protein product (macronuclear) [Paramecium tetraurelia]|uniref:Transmembrane protein n=1 Tax=Paramecium tetraurelia TaxID=5888 RepID=A0BWX4_PARTE|nr:uncharacterized protein GSPATT00032893001 [Paramecium tetraurelia]CAK63041.1 unnamed protein product [Paramecium tetraurelia]|eukprot:XP_001430439.1 hypothetical protein (macronuclear) [Paramecium tetraurelia strain d4-2]